jgi:hypothetical protein
MFRKLVTAALLSVALSTSVGAQQEAERFFEITRNGWITHGRYAFEKDNPHCVTSKWFEDGSAFTVVRDLADQEIYITVRNVKWEFTQPKGTPDTLNMNAHKKGKFYKGLRLTGHLVNKNTIILRNMPFEFLTIFEEANTLDLIMPGDDANARVDLSGSGDALTQLNRCLKAGEKVDDLYQNVKPRHPRTTL